MASKVSMSGSSGGGIIFRDTFYVKHKDKDAKRLPVSGLKVAQFRDVSRYDCEASIKKASLTIDIASKVYPLEQDTEITFAISTKLRKEGEDPEDFDQSGEKSHLDDYEYGMYGKVFEYKSKGGDDGDMVEIFASFGGLLMKLVAPKAELKSVSLDDYIYVLIKKNVGSYM